MSGEGINNLPQPYDLFATTASGQKDVTSEDAAESWADFAERMDPLTEGEVIEIDTTGILGAIFHTLPANIQNQLTRDEARRRRAIPGKRGALRK